jgi:hypothetical protein|tara:strand:+ start:629 stop:1168 length:540 start_codon:yes stop_codon:yes gene_type:complete
MGYGAGRSTLLRDIGTERASERARYEQELNEAEDAKAADSSASSLWSMIGSFIGASIGFYTGGPQGAYRGYAYGKEAGKWGYEGVGALTGTGYDPEDYAVSTDVGKFDVSQKYELEDINRMFVEADRAEFWKDVTDTGITAMSLFAAPKMEGAEWWTKADGGAPEWLRDLRTRFDKVVS